MQEWSLYFVRHFNDQIKALYSEMFNDLIQSFSWIGTSKHLTDSPHIWCNILTDSHSLLWITRVDTQISQLKCINKMCRSRFSKIQFNNNCEISHSFVHSIGSKGFVSMRIFRNENLFLFILFHCCGATELHPFLCFRFIFINLEWTFLRLFSDPKKKCPMDRLFH